MDNHILIHADSGNVEYYTPAHILQAVRHLLVHIDLDPASSAAANKVVQATQFYTKEDDGLSKLWYGRVFMNHPFSRQGNPLWINKLVASYDDCAIDAAVCICFAAVNAAWFAPLLNYPQFFFKGRVNYCNPDGTVAKGVTKDSVITYLPPTGEWGAEIKRLQAVFDRYGIEGKAK